MHIVAHFVSSKTLKVLEEKVLFVIRAELQFCTCFWWLIFWYADWRRKFGGLLSTSELLVVFCYSGWKQNYCLCLLGQKIVCEFFNVEGGVLGISQFDQWINKGGWEEVEALAGEVPIPINFLLLDIMIDWLRQWFFALKWWFFSWSNEDFSCFSWLFTCSSAINCVKKFFRLTSDDTHWKQVNLN